MKLFFKRETGLDPLQKKEIKKDRLYLIISGILLGLSFPPFPFPYLLFGALIPYYIVLEKKKTLAEINRATYLMAFVFSLLTIYWVGGFVVGKDPFLLISGFLLLFANPIIFLIGSTLFYFSTRVFSTKISFILFPFFWVTYEYAYMITDWSFPWITLGNGLAKFTSFIQIADHIGVIGLSLLVLFINLFFYFSLTYFGKNKTKFLTNGIAALALILFPLLYGWIVLANSDEGSKKIRVGLIQPDLDPYDKWSGGNTTTLTNEYFTMSKEAIDKGAQFLIWPETAFPFYLMTGSYSEIVDSMRSFLLKNQVPLLTGMPHVEFFSKKEEGPFDVKKSKESELYFATYNSVLFFTPNSFDVLQYGKMKLVPFGERTPFVSQLPFLGDLIKWGVGLSGWNIGQDTTVFKYEFVNNENQPDSINMNGLICYESVYPDLVAAFCQKGSEFITVVTNDSWYGNTSGPYQHKEISVLRAVENRRSVVRAANGGISCIIDKYGRTIKESKMYEKAIVVGDVYPNNELTFFSKNPNLFPVFSSAISIWILGLFILFKLKNRESKSNS